MDPKYFPDPDRFDPERFNDENKKSIVQGSYLPFSMGPRNCVVQLCSILLLKLFLFLQIHLQGTRFALMFMKVAIYYLVLNFKLDMSEKSTYPIQLKKNTAFVDADFWMNVIPRT